MAEKGKKGRGMRKGEEREGKGEVGVDPTKFRRKSTPLTACLLHVCYCIAECNLSKIGGYVEVRTEFPQGGA